MGLELFLVTDKEYTWLAGGWERLRSEVRERLRVPEPTAVLFIDGFCSYCRLTGETLRRLDWRGRLEVVSFREDDRFRRLGLSAEALELRMHLVEPRSGRVFAGFDAVEALALRMLSLWPLLPLLWLARASGQGQRLYDFLASRRLIVPDARACGEGACAVPARAAAEER
ncbi:DUF393 domain-containing protein [Pyxidicoccus fallax]|uniref:DUF393 domain-containing protein n=2 Tax=Pyxidicoccus fallax TaxID=394095 RepID=A0A848LSD0_9BACT|nr:DUF393 domain-containing protein [Pyxidicoccus fallax]NPC84014.1 DUF393 domain-containing protein [Pyxidicoccus fallax]